MKSSNKSSIITGTILLTLAAAFSICLLLQLLDFGVGGPGHNNIFYYIGNMLITVYGFSSILIPAFLLISGLSCFASIWTAKKTMRLITAILYLCCYREDLSRCTYWWSWRCGNFWCYKSSNCGHYRPYAHYYWDSWRWCNCRIC